jgi:hypothetical protein
MSILDSKAELVGLVTMGAGEFYQVFETFSDGNCLLAYVLWLLGRAEHQETCRRYRRHHQDRIEAQDFGAALYDNPLQRGELWY